MGIERQQILTKIQSVSGKTSNNRYLKAISNGLISILPVIIIGAFATLLANMNIGGYQDFIESIGLKTMFMIPANVTTGMLALYTVFFIAYRLASYFEKDGVGAGLIALICFLVLTPLSQLDDANVIPVEYLGAKGLFVAIIVGLTVSRLYVLIIDSKFLIRLPDSVPPTIGKSFNNLVPGIVITIIFTIVNVLFQLTTYENVHEFIYSILQAPLLNLGGGYWSLVVMILVIHLLWFIGVHGMLVVLPIYYSIWMPLGLENLDAIAAGETPTNIVHTGFYTTFISLGGAGATLGLCILMAFFAKSKRYKSLGKISLPASIFSINEPITFGTPIILNPYMFIPFIFAPLIIGTISYFTMLSGIIPIANGTHLPIGTPIILGPIVQGGLILIIWQFICIGMSVLIYYPFFRALDRKALTEEISSES
ncbi:PTS sugar transporter subunit IIC [Gracilibacillus suaedae]|uniref:PTS sugar transporter subunit IIC n=1 Tax=Gracilibacillus suaedae TaxID=2820273 RepID=UPI001ABE11A2|nr:PTS transporter subunit EIIC [Gracilibacillus suaedae]